MNSVGSIDLLDPFGIRGWVHAPAAARVWLQIGDIQLPVNPGVPRPDVRASGAAPVPDAGYSCEFADLDERIRRDLSHAFRGKKLKVSLHADGEVLAKASLRTARMFTLEIADDGEGRISGWVTAGQWPPSASVELLADGHVFNVQRLTRVDEVRARREGRAWGCDFSARLPCSVSGVRATVSARIGGTLGQPAPSVDIRVPAHATRDARVAMARTGARERLARPVAIVVPVHKAASAFFRCMDALVAHTTRNADLILIDDHSQDAAITRRLNEMRDLHRATVIVNESNLGFTRSVNLGITAAQGADVVVLNSDTRVGPRWLEMLEQAAYGAPEIGSATAVSDNAGAFTLPGPGPAPRPGGLADEDWQRHAAQAAGLLHPETPTGSGFCMFIKRACLDSTGLFDADAFPRGYGEENEWCLRAGLKGWRHVVDERCLVLHERSASFGAEKKELAAAGQDVVRARHPDYPARVASFIDGVGMRLSRARLVEANSRLDAARPPRPRALFVISTTGGGTPLTNQDLMAALEDRWDAWLLQSDSRTLRLFQVSGAHHRLVETWKLARPVDPADHRSEEYDTIVARWMTAYAIDLVHVRHVGWHGLDLTRVAQELSIPVLFSFHDFYTLCPTVKLLDDRGEFCGGQCTVDRGRDCVPDLWTGRRTPPLKNAWIKPWRAYMRLMLAHCDGFATTSASARELILRWFPELAAKPFEVISHGRDLIELPAIAPPAPAPGDKLKILALGTLTAAKGADLILGALEAGAGEHAEFHVLGETPGIEARPGLVVHGPYRRDELVARIAAIKPHVGAVLSTWPETWSHTMTELWRCGLPIIATRLGAPGERLAAGGPGWPLDPQDGSQALRALVEKLSQSPQEVAQAQERAGRWSGSPTITRSSRDMAEDYHRLYLRLMDARRSLARADGSLRTGSYTAP